MAKGTGGVNLPEDDLDDVPEERNSAPKIMGAAKERKRGGRAGLKRGGEAHEERPKRRRGGRMDGKKMVEVHGEHEKRRADRKPRKDGGRTGSDQAPYSSARRGTDPTDHKTEMENPEG